MSYVPFLLVFLTLWLNTVRRRVHSILNQGRTEQQLLKQTHIFYTFYSLLQSSERSFSLFSEPTFTERRQQRPCGQRHKLPYTALGKWIWIPLEAWMSLCSFRVCVVLRVAALRRADSPSKESNRLQVGLRNLKSGRSPTKGCRAINNNFT
jgi:hypothetical protein